MTHKQRTYILNPIIQRDAKCNVIHLSNRPRSFIRVSMPAILSSKTTEQNIESMFDLQMAKHSFARIFFKHKVVNYIWNLF